jgi:hypothetical protein
MKPPYDALHAADIHNLLARFFATFDEKNWQAMREYLCEEVFVDYSAFCAMPASTMAAGRYIEEGRAALDWLDTQHDFHNLHVSVDAIEGSATARCNYVIRRFLPGLDGTHYFHSFGHYHFDLISLHGAWRIARIRQDLLRNEGDREIHAAVWCA